MLTLLPLFYSESFPLKIAYAHSKDPWVPKCWVLGSSSKVSNPRSSRRQASIFSSPHQLLIFIVKSMVWHPLIKNLNDHLFLVVVLRRQIWWVSVLLLPFLTSDIMQQSLAIISNVCSISSGSLNPNPSPLRSKLILSTI